MSFRSLVLKPTTRMVMLAMTASVLATATPLMAQEAAAPAAAVAQQAQTPVTSLADLSAVPAPVLAARAWISIDLTSGQVLTSKDPDVQVEPASITKVMTAYVVFQALKENRLSLDQQAIVSEFAWKTGGSRMFIEPRKPVTVDELLQGMIVQSGNDASVALAEAVAGSEPAFAALMNQQAERMGMSRSYFENATGLPGERHLVSVRDLAILAEHLIEDFPEYYHYYQQREYSYNNITQANRNRLLWADPSVDGLKTGHTSSAGYCLVATAKRGDRRIVTVIVGADSEAARAEESLKLLNWSFQNFDTVKLLDADQPAVQAQVWEGEQKEVGLGVPEAVWLTVPRGKAGDVQSVARRTDPLVAPLTQGQRVGTLDLTLDGQVLRSEPLQVLTPVERAGFFGRMADTVRRWFN